MWGMYCDCARRGVPRELRATSESRMGLVARAGGGGVCVCVCVCVVVCIWGVRVVYQHEPHLAKPAFPRLEVQPPRWGCGARPRGRDRALERQRRESPQAKGPPVPPPANTARVISFPRRYQRTRSIVRYVRDEALVHGRGMYV